MIKTLLSMFSIGLSCAANSLPLGAEIPDLESTNQDGQVVNLKQEAAKTPYLLVYFYPKSHTPGCTKQGCSLRDEYTELTEKGVSIIGVSNDSVKAQKSFTTKHQFPFTLLADKEGEVIKAFGVKTIRLTKMASRQAYLFKNGKLIWKTEKAPTSKQAAQILEVIAQQK